MLIELQSLSSVDEKGVGAGEVFVNLCVDGSAYLAGLQLNEVEHNRRKNLGLGALTSTGLLHSLWEIPHGIPFLRESLKSFDLAELDNGEPGWIGEHDGKMIRHYQPPGTVRSIVVADESLAAAVSRAARHPMTVRRTAVWFRQSTRLNLRAENTLSRAHALGIGVIVAKDGQMAQLVPSLDAMRGRPAVFRWWQAELAYRNWLRCTGPIV